MSKVAELSQRFLNHQGVSFTEGPGGHVQVGIKNSSGELTVSLYGGHILTARLGSEVFWLSTEARYEKGIAIRGGVPIVFPWFGGHFDDPNLPAHGFARISDWDLSDVDATTIRLSLMDNDVTREIWPHRFRVEQTISLTGGTLNQSMKVTNVDSKVWSFAAGFHPYFRVSKLSSTRVSGLAKRPYVNLVDRTDHRGEELVSFGSEIDRAYFDKGESLSIQDTGYQREVGISCEGCDSVVVWNPGLGKSKSDMPSGGPDEFICVEPARAATADGWDKCSWLKSGETTTFSYKISVTQSN